MTDIPPGWNCAMSNSRHLALEIVSGEEIGRDPRTMRRDELHALGHQPVPVLNVIRAKCADCCGGSAAEARKCVATSCALWPYRTGSNPFRAKRVLSEAEKVALRDRLTVQREAA